MAETRRIASSPDPGGGLGANAPNRPFLEGSRRSGGGWRRRIRPRRHGTRRHRLAGQVASLSAWSRPGRPLFFASGTQHVTPMAAQRVPVADLVGALVTVAGIALWSLAFHLLAG